MTNELEQDSITAERVARIKADSTKVDKPKGVPGNLVELSIGGNLQDTGVSIWDFDQTGTAIRVMELHLQEKDPHTQYITKAELRSMLAPLFGNRSEEK
jgi:hypothetical protein